MQARTAFLLAALAQPLAADTDPFMSAALWFDQGEYAQAHPLLTQLDRQGDLRASFLLCLQYMEGLGVEADPPRGFRLCHKAADHGFPPAVRATAEHYLMGRGTEPNPARGIALLTGAAEAGDLDAQIALAQVYAGAVDEQQFDPERMLHYLRLAAAQGQPEGLFIAGSLQLALADVFPNQYWPSREEALAQVLQAANMNYPPAQFALGELYYEGKLVAGDAAQSLFWFTLADRAGHPDARARRFDLELGTNSSIRAAVTRRLNSWQPQPVPASH